MAAFSCRVEGESGSNPWGGAARVLQGDHLVGKYCCLLCPKEFSSESGVKYHILKAHAEVGGAALCEGPKGLGGLPTEGTGPGGG